MFVSRTARHKYELVILCLSALAGCPGTGNPPINPFLDLPPIALDGEPHEAAYSIVPLGEFAAGEVLRLQADGDNVEAVLVLAEYSVLAEEDFDDAGVIAGGGPANEPFQYRVRVPGRYYLFIQFDSQASSNQRATISAQTGDVGFVPPSTQHVLVIFEDGFLSGKDPADPQFDPEATGLWDPESNTTEDREFLASISGEVRDGVVERLRTIFLNTPVTISTEADPLPPVPFSRVTLRPHRVLAEDTDVIDAALPLVNVPPECEDSLVIFGEVLPHGALRDPGNQKPDDEAVVNVGSFQGRGETCGSAAINSVNNIILGLAHTAAHEIGHLIGLYHVPLTDIMDRSPTLAFQRELLFRRQQILLDARREDSDGNIDVTSVLLTSIYQDAAFYFQANFGE